MPSIIGHVIGKNAVTAPPPNPKIYHIVHVDRLASIAADDALLCDAVIAKRNAAGTMIGINEIKQRRLGRPLLSRPGLRVGDCVPFYFCPRSVMLYVIHCANHASLAYRDGQDSIVHLEADLHAAIDWAESQSARWAFTLSNAGSAYFEDRCERAQLSEIAWEAVGARKWAGRGVSGLVKEGKQAEFLIEGRFPWPLVERIGVRTRATGDRVQQALAAAGHRPRLEIRTDWYYS